LYAAYVAPPNPKRYNNFLDFGLRSPHAFHLAHLDGFFIISFCVLSKISLTLPSPAATASSVAFATLPDAPLTV
jgi:hypothetical protein